MKRLLILAMVLLCAGITSAQQHPSILLNPATLNSLQAKAQANDPSWRLLKQRCDQYLSGSVHFPDGQDYPNPPDIGSGYQGEEYYPRIMEEGLCYHTMARINAPAGVVYGNKLVDILMKMSDPVHQVKSPPTGNAIQVADSGYGIRNYGVAMAIGYDWARDAMTSAQRQQVYTALNVWVNLWTQGWVYANVRGGVIISVTVNVYPAYYFSTTPSVSFSGCGGSGATATATLSNGYVSSITVSNGGQGYTCSPTVYFNGESYASQLWEAEHPLSNYFAGYYATEVLTALATAGDNPNASAYWNHWYTITHGRRVAPWVGTYLKGGGWPEGEADYGPLATRHYNIVTVPVKDAKSIDLVHAATQPYTWGVDNVDYLLYFTWPNLNQYYAEDDVHNKGATVVNYAHPDLYEFTYFLGKYWNQPHVQQFHRFTKDVLASVNGTWGVNAPEWQQFLFWNAGDADADYTTLPLSYKLDGMQRVAVRSDWTSSAVWWAFNASPYIDSPSQGEQFYGTGQFEIVHGSTPFIVLPVAWITNISPAAEQRMLDNLYHGQPRQRSWFNTFQVPSLVQNSGEWAGISAIPPLPPRENDKIGGTGRTGLSAYEDTSRYVLTAAHHLEDMYQKWNLPECGPVTAWTRQLLYLRATNHLIVYDRTSICRRTYPQLLAFYTLVKPSLVSQSPAVPGTTRLDVSYKSVFAGSIISVLPTGAMVSVGDLESPPSNAVWRTTISPAVAQTSNRWVTVFDMNASPATVWNASALASSGNTMQGVLLQGPISNNVVLSNSGDENTTVAGTISYVIPARPSMNVLTELSPSSRYEISVTGESQETVTVTPNKAGAYATTANGVLSFTISSGGTVAR